MKTKSGKWKSVRYRCQQISKLLDSNEWTVSQLLISESLRGMGMSFGCSDLWDRLGGQASVMIGQ